MALNYDLFGSRTARDQGLAQVSGNASSFMSRGIAYIRDHLPPGDYTSEDINARLVIAGIDPHTPKAYGALTSHAVRLGLLQDTGRVRQMKKYKSHARRTPVWRRPAW
jgi:hypothetical protein